MHSFFQQSVTQKLTEWQTENTRLTKELCTDLLSKLKRQHLDPILHQLQWHGGSDLFFDDIIGVCHRIKDDYDGQAVGAKDVTAAAFFDFQPVSIFMHDCIELFSSSLRNKSSHNSQGALIQPSPPPLSF